MVSMNSLLAQKRSTECAENGRQRCRPTSRKKTRCHDAKCHGAKGRETGTEGRVPRDTTANPANLGRSLDTSLRRFVRLAESASVEHFFHVSRSRLADGHRVARSRRGKRWSGSPEPVAPLHAGLAL